MDTIPTNQSARQRLHSNPFRRLGQDRRLGCAVVILLAALSGLLVALLMPRAPATTAQALSLLAGGLGVGFLAGRVLPSRWTFLLLAAVHWLALELGRRGVVGPTVDAIRLDSSYGILAFLLGRVFYAVLAVLPMLLGLSLGSRLARRWSGLTASGRPAGRLRRILRGAPTALLALVLLALAVLIALPARTPPILGADGRPQPGSVAELTDVRIGGHDQALMIRGQSTDNPVLLYLSGGPGQSSLPFPRVILSDLEQDVIVVGWDQRGTGKSYAALDPTETLTLERAVSDTIEVTDYLRQRFDEDKIYLLGESWGTTLGVLAAQRRPDLYYAFLGSGQMVSQRETDRRLYADVLEYAAQTGDTALAAKMRAYGEPPYADMPYAYGFVMNYYDALYKPYSPPAADVESGQAAHLGPMGVLGSEYNLVDKVNVLRGLLDMFTVLYPQLQGIDLRRDVPRLDVPVYLLDGAAELAARRDLALEWFDLLQAPQKRLYTFENAAHAVAFEQFEAFHRLLLDTVLPETYPPAE